MSYCLLQKSREALTPWKGVIPSLRMGCPASGANTKAKKFCFSITTGDNLLLVL